VPAAYHLPRTAQGLGSAWPYPQFTFGHSAHRAFRCWGLSTQPDKGYLDKSVGSLRSWAYTIIPL
jgi:hypothetical protein